MLIITLSGCKQNNKQVATNVLQTTIDTTLVNVYYFHGKQRCKTCIAVGNIAKETVETVFANNDKVRFSEINTSEKAFKSLVEQYEVTWNALIIVRSDNFVEITDQAFATAVNNPQSLKNLIKEAVNQRLK